MSTSTSSSSRARRAGLLVVSVACHRRVRQRRLDAEPALLSGRSDRARAGIAGRLEGGAVRSVADVRAGVQPVRHVGLQAERPAREEHQHDRRSARLELVHQPHRHQGDHDRRARARRQCRRAARPVEVGADPGKDGGRAPGLHGDGRQGRDLVPRVRSAALSGRRDRGGRDRDQDLLGARLQPGGIVPDDLRSEEARRSIRRPRVRRPNGKRTPFTQRRHERHPRERRAQRRTAPIASSPAACCPARFSAASSTRARAPTIPTISCRTSTAASCARCASSARGRTSPTSRPRTRSTRSSPRTASRSSSTTCRTSARRSACATTSTSGT